MKKNITLILLFLGSLTLSAQQADSVKADKPVEKKEEFKQNGKVESDIHNNFNVKIEGDNTTYGFAFTRAFFGYKHNLSENFTAHVRLDLETDKFQIATDKDTVTKTKLLAYFNKANLQYKVGNLQVQFGVIGLTQFDTNEKLWGYRYVYKTFQDQNKFGNTSDLGISILYSFIDQLSADITVANGEGMKSLQLDNDLKYALGVSAMPFKGMIIRAYGDYNQIDDSVNVSNITGLIGYEKKEKFRVGVELTRLFNYKGKQDRHFLGFSAYGTYYIFKKLNVFARYDILKSNVIDPDISKDPWNLSKDGNTFIGGIEFSPAKVVNLSLNAQRFTPLDKTLDNNFTVYLSTQIKF